MFGIRMEAFAGEVLLAFPDKDHAPVRLGGRERSGEEEGAQNAPTAVSEHRAAIALFGDKTKSSGI